MGLGLGGSVLLVLVGVLLLVVAYDIATRK
jgi:hypothetical protein